MRVTPIGTSNLRVGLFCSSTEELAFFAFDPGVPGMEYTVHALDRLAALLLRLMFSLLAWAAFRLTQVLTIGRRWGTKLRWRALIRI